jgi:hypothetical protein
MMAKTKTCAGVPKLGIKPHDAPASTEAFTAKSANPDGLSRRCKACQSADRTARRGSAPSGPGQAKAAKADPTPAAKKKAATAKRAKATPKAKPAPTAAVATTATNTSAEATPLPAPATSAPAPESPEAA